MVKLFPGQQDNEEVCLVLRQHWLVFFKEIFFWLIFLGILALADYAVNTFLSGVKGTPLGHLINLAETVYFMFLILTLLIIWVLYFLNAQIITNKRIVDITQKSLLHHTISELPLNRIQDVTAEVKGFLETFFNYGHVYVQSAGETERFVFQRIGNPAKVSKLILDLYEKLPPEEKAKGKD